MATKTWQGQLAVLEELASQAGNIPAQMALVELTLLRLREGDVPGARECARSLHVALLAIQLEGEGTTNELTHPHGRKAQGRQVTAR